MSSIVSIIMPAYNAETTIEKSISGILNQSFKDWTLYVINDGSTDNTLAIVQKYDDNRIKIINKENGGVSSARNAAITSMEPSRYTAYCDADDVWKENHLQESINVLEEGTDFVYSTPEFITEDGNTVFPNFPIYKTFEIKNLRRNNFIWISSVVHKGIIGLFDSNLDSLEDYDLWIRAVKRWFSFKQLDTRTVTYLVKNNGMAQKGAQVRKKLQLKHLDFIQPLKLHLGCGTEYFDDFINCDLYAEKVDLKIDVKSLSFPNNSVDEIMAYHVIEHFDFMESQDVIKEWYRVLKPGGRLHLETPDLLSTCRHFVVGTEQERVTLYGHFFAWPWLPGQTHKFLFTESQMEWLLSQVGFKFIRRLSPDSIYANSGVPADLFLNVECYK